MSVLERGLRLTGFPSKEVRLLEKSQFIVHVNFIFVKNFVQKSLR